MHHKVLALEQAADGQQVVKVRHQGRTGFGVRTQDPAEEGGRVRLNSV